MRNLCTLVLLWLIITPAMTQNLKQTVRGTLLDEDSRQSLIGAVVEIEGSDPKMAVVTDMEGRFKFDSVPVGRITLLLSYMGYENTSVPNIEVTSGKEVVLEFTMRESYVQMEGVVIKAHKNKGEALNEMAIVSSRSISLEETKRQAGGSFNDPARALSNYAGVTSTQDGSNDIIVRGNSPKYVQWRMEGIEITSPNHFSDQSSVGGGITAINNSLLSTSDFYTGAFAPEFGDVLSGVYDLHLRSGNNEKFEATLGAGIIGTDFTVEGPFKKGYGGSYLANYRYANTTLIQGLGLIDVEGGLPIFQDGAFKISLPTKNAGKFSLFGLGGKSSFLFKDVDASIWNTPGDQGMQESLSEDYEKHSYLGNLGINHLLPLGENSFLRTTVAFSGEGVEDKVYQTEQIQTMDQNGMLMMDSTGQETLNYHSDIDNRIIRTALTYSHKFNAKHKIQVGIKYNYFQSIYKQSYLAGDGQTRLYVNDFNENIGTVRNFFSWRYRITEDVSMVAGIHNMNVLLNNKSTLEPRLAFRWQMNPKNAVSVGYGNHSTMERVHHYFARIPQGDGSYTEPNKDLDLLKAHHFVLAYEKRFTPNLMMKVEAYYQHLYDLPVENVDTSYYATVNESTEIEFHELVNEGTGANYGLELTLERFFAKHYYFLFNTSVYASKYKWLENLERNTTFNGEYLFNFLCGKEFTGLGKKKNKTIGLNFKLFFGGARKIIPLLRDGNGDLDVDPEANEYWDYGKAYNAQLDNIYNFTASVTYKVNRPKASHEISLDLNNLTNATARITEFYDPSVPGSINYQRQFGFFPNLMYRMYF